MTIKENVHLACSEELSSRIETIKKAMASAEESMMNETKSSAGDKYETGRAMMHLEKDKHSRQLAEALKLKQTLQLVNTESRSEQIGLGSLVYTSIGNFYIAISAGKYTETAEDIHCISLASPIGQALAGYKEKEKLRS